MPGTGRSAVSEIDALTRELNDIEDQLGKLYRQRDPILLRLAELRNYSLPKPRYRTPTQQAIAYCPRCRGKISG